MGKRPTVFDIAGPLSAAMATLTKDGKPPTIRYGVQKNVGHFKQKLKGQSSVVEISGTIRSEAREKGGKAWMVGSSWGRLWDAAISGSNPSSIPIYDHVNNIIYLPTPKVGGYTANEENLLRAVLGSQIAGAQFKVRDGLRPDDGAYGGITASTPTPDEDKNIGGRRAGMPTRSDIESLKKVNASGRASASTKDAAVVEHHWKSELTLRGVESGMVNGRVAELWPGYEVALRQGWKAILRSRRIDAAKAKRQIIDFTRVNGGDPNDPLPAKNKEVRERDLAALARRTEGTASDYAALIGAGLNGLDLADQSRRFAKFGMHELADMAMKAKAVLHKLGVEGKPPLTEDECVALAKKVYEELDQPQENPDDGDDQDGDGQSGEGEGDEGGQGDAANAPNISDLVGRKDMSMNPDFTEAVGKASDSEAGTQDDNEEDPDNLPEGERNYFSDMPCTLVRIHQGKTAFSKGLVLGDVGYSRCASAVRNGQHYNCSEYILDVDNEAGVLAQMFRQAIRSPTLLDDSRHQVGRFDVRQIARAKTGNRDVFTRRTYLEGDEVAVGILVDGSSSMCSGSVDRNGNSIYPKQLKGQGVYRSHAASRAANILATALVRNEMECAVWHYSTGWGGVIQHYHNQGWLLPNDNPANDNAVIEVKAFGSGRKGLEEARIALVGGMQHGGTPTSGATYLALNEMARRPESRRILFLMTDGDVGHGEVMKQQMARAEAEGIDLIVVGIDLGAGYDEQMKQMFGHRYVASYGDEGAQVMAKAISNILLASARRTAR